MARHVLTDPLQVFSFWLFDASVVEAIQLPVFTPLAGFARISMPELSLETQDINEGNWYFAKKVVKRASISNITLERAATFYYSDFWRWMIATITGDVKGARWFGGRSLFGQVIGGVSPRRTLVLVQFLARSAGIAFNNQTPIGPLDSSLRQQSIPRIPAKAWVLHGCLPIRMKPGSDFDASSSDISMAEIELAVEQMEEISLGDPL